MLTHDELVLFSSCITLNKNNEEAKYIHNEIFNNIPHFIKKRLHVDCLQDGFVMYKNKVILRKIEFIPPIPDSMIPMYF